MAIWGVALRSVLPSLSGRDDLRPGPEIDRPKKQQQKESAGLADTPDPLAENARAHAPVVWLLGKVQSGKTSVIRAITQVTDAEIGDGFRPCTRTSRIYEFPGEAPVLRFLDTRGLGEIDYDPADDLAFNEAAAHLLLVTMRATDPDQTAVIKALHAVRERHPGWPVVVAQTSLHDAYRPGEGHTLPYPFDPKAPVSAIESIPTDLMRGLAYQRAALDKLAGHGPLLFVPVDLTKPEDGFTPRDYGLDALTETLAAVAPAGLLAALEAMPGFQADPKARSADPIVMGHAMAAAGGDLVPIPVAGAIAASTIQARMLSQLGRHYGIEWDRRALTELTAALGAGTLARVAAGIGVRQLAKMLPVYGQTAGTAAAAAASFAVTYALGKAAVKYLHGRRVGATDRKVIAETYQQALRDAFRMAKEQRRSATGEPKP